MYRLQLHNVRAKAPTDRRGDPRKLYRHEKRKAAARRARRDAGALEQLRIELAAQLARRPTSVFPRWDRARFPRCPQCKCSLSLNPERRAAHVCKRGTPSDAPCACGCGRPRWNRTRYAHRCYSARYRRRALDGRAVRSGLTRRKWEHRVCRCGNGRRAGHRISSRQWVCTPCYHQHRRANPHRCAECGYRHRRTRHSKCSRCHRREAVAKLGRCACGRKATQRWEGAAKCAPCYATAKGVPCSRCATGAVHARDLCARCYDEDYRAQPHVKASRAVRARAAYYEEQGHTVAWVRSRSEMIRSAKRDIA